MKTPYNPRGFNFPDIDSDMVAYYHFDQGTGTSIDDSTPPDRDLLLNDNSAWESIHLIQKRLIVLILVGQSMPIERMQIIILLLMAQALMKNLVFHSGLI